MDKKDRKILNILQNDGRIQNVDLAEAMGMAPSGTLNRVNKLVKKGTIKSHHTAFNYKEIGFGLLAFVWIRTKTTNWEDSSGKELAKIPGVLEVHEIAGEYSYLLKIRAADVETLSNVLKKELQKIGEIHYSNTTIVLNTIEEHGVLPIEGYPEQ